MNSYELILLFDPALGEEKIDAAVGKVEDKIRGLGAEIKKTEKLGAKKLASRVRRAKWMTQGYYVLINFCGAPSLPSELISYLRVSENIIRYFVSRVEEFPAVSAEEKEIAGTPLAAGELKEGSEVGQP
ncbi:MAG: 30S ribosomal protein S6 [Candidatus Margulisiibacteriota bacterium]